MHRRSTGRRPRPARRRRGSASTRVMLVIGLMVSAVDAPAVAHDGVLPASQAVLRRDGRAVVPSRYFGAFVGPDTPRAAGGGWRWLCGEAVNGNPARQWAMLGDGTLLVTDFAGLAVSHDGGCTWSAATGEIATRSTGAVVPDPVEPARAWVTTSSGVASPWNGLFTTSDGGRSFRAVLQVDELLRGAAVSADGSTLYTAGLTRSGARDLPPILHVSRDRGGHFQDLPIDHRFAGLPPEDVILLGVPSQPSHLLLVAMRGDQRALLESADFGAHFAERAAPTTFIGAMVNDPVDGSTLLASQAGLLRAAPGGEFVDLGGLGATGCLSAGGDALYTCVLHADPTLPIVLRGSREGAFEPLLRPIDIEGPMTTCPPESQVARLCPALWPAYAYHFQIAPVIPDGSTRSPDMAGAGPGPGPSCAVGGHAPAGGTLALLLCAALALLRRSNRVSALFALALALVLVAAPACQGPGTGEPKGGRLPTGETLLDVAGPAGLLEAPPLYGRGAAFIDFDLDGWEDVWLSDAGTGIGGYPGHSRLYRNQGDGTFKPFETHIPTAHLVCNWSAAWGDHDNDGDPDLFLANGGLCQNAARAAFYRNDVPTGGGFVDVTEQLGVTDQPLHFWGAAFGDYDGDGWLDLVVDTVAPDLLTGTWGDTPLLLYHNEGGRGFVDVAERLGVHSVPGNAKNSVWFDFDHDGDIDLYVAGMQDHRFFRNDGVKGFTDVTATLLPHFVREPGVFGAVAADFDQDGWEDLYLGRYSEQALVLRNQHDGTFAPLGREIGLDMVTGKDTVENTMGLATADFNDDGFPDLVIGPGTPGEARPPVAYCNRGRPLAFQRCSEPFLAAHPTARHHGFAAADYDHDGDTDLINNLGGMLYNAPPPGSAPSWDVPALYSQQRPSPAQTAVVKLEGTTSNRQALNARIEVEGAEKHYYTVHNIMGQPSQNSEWLVLQLGQPQAVAHIDWPSGTRSDVNLSVGQRLVVREP